MPSNYWIKLYHEILDDPKMMQMPEILFGRCIKLFLLAGDENKDGLLPSISDISWRLRIPEEEIESDLIELQKAGIANQDENGWRITKWKDRQRAATGSERTNRWRERKHRAEYKGVETKSETFWDGSATKRHTDIDID